MSLAIRDAMETWRKQEGRHFSSMSTNCNVLVTVETAWSAMASMLFPFISLWKRKNNKCFHFQLQTTCSKKWRLKITKAYHQIGHSKREEKNLQPLASDWLRIWRDTFSQSMVVAVQKKGNRRLSFKRQLINTLQLQQLVLHQSKIRIIILTCSPPGCVNPQSEGTSSQLAVRDPYKDVKEMIEHDEYCGEPMTWSGERKRTIWHFCHHEIYFSQKDFKKTACKGHSTFAYLEVAKARLVPLKEPTNMELIDGRFLCALATSSPLVAVAVSYVNGMEGVARDISDKSFVTPKGESPSLTLKEDSKQEIRNSCQRFVLRASWKQLKQTN